MISQEFKIAGMSCGHCVMAIKKELSKLNIESMEVEVGSAKVKFDQTKVSVTEIVDAIIRAGYKVVN